MEDEIKRIVNELRNRTNHFLKLDSLEAKVYFLNLYEWFIDFDVVKKIVNNSKLYFSKNEIFIKPKDGEDMFHPLSFLHRYHNAVEELFNSPRDKTLYEEFAGMLISDKNQLLACYQKIDKEEASGEIYSQYFFEELKKLIAFYFFRFADLLIDAYIFKKSYTKELIKEDFEEIENIEILLDEKKSIVKIGDYAIIKLHPKNNLEGFDNKKLIKIFRLLSKKKKNWFTFNELKKQNFIRNDFHRYLNYLNKIFEDPKRIQKIKENIIIKAEKDPSSKWGNPMVKIKVLRPVENLVQSLDINKKPYINKKQPPIAFVLP